MSQPDRNLIYNGTDYEIILNTNGTYNLFGEAVIRVRWHTCGDVEDGFHRGGSIVRSC